MMAVKPPPVSLAFALLLAACSGGGGGGSSPPPAGIASLELVAGHAGGPSNIDGTGPVARFTNPIGLAVDAAGNVFVGSSCAIRKVTPAGVVTTPVNTGCPFSSSDPQSSLYGPSGLALDAAGNLYALDGQTTVRRILPSGAITTLTPDSGIGSACTPRDGPLATVSFCYIDALATNAAGDLFVSSTTDIRKISASGLVSTVAGRYLQFGDADGMGPAALFSGIDAVATDGAGNIYAADYVTKTIRVVTPGGAVTTLAGRSGVQGSADGPATAATFMFPNGIATDFAGNVYVADFGHAIRKISPDGQVTTLAGSAGMAGSSDGVGAAARFGGGQLSIGADPAGNLYVADYNNDDIRRITPDGAVTTIAGSPPVSGTEDGVGTAATFSKPLGIAADSAGNLYVADGGNPQAAGRHAVRRVSPSGAVTTLAGAGLDNIAGIVADGSGNAYISDSSCPLLPPPGPGLPMPPCSGTIEKVSPGGSVITIAGAVGVSGSADGAGSAASFMQPVGIAADASGNLLVVDMGAAVIRKVSPAGVATTLAGSPGARGMVDGIGSAARFNHPAWIAVDKSGTAYVTDRFDGSIRKVSPLGEVTTLVAPGLFKLGLQGIGVDDQGNLYVADYWDCAIYKVTPSGMATPVVGVPGQASFEPGALPGKVFYPVGIVVNGGNLYFTLGDGVAAVRPLP